VVIHRWRDRYAEYARYLDHERYAVSYVATDVGQTAVPASAAAVSVVAHTDDLAEVRAAIQAHVERFGSPEGIVALKEDDLLVAARLREEWACPGPEYADLLPFRDKYLTYQAALRAGLSAPICAPVSSPAEIITFAAGHGWPVVVKPRDSSSSEGVLVLTGPDPTELVDFGDNRPRIAQVYDSRPIYHVDGVFADGRLGPWKASRYLNNCLDFRTGQVLGSVEEDEPAAVATIGTFAERLLNALTRKPVVFHLEVFLAGEKCALLEVAARVGGAEIAFLWREVHGVDLMGVAFDIQLGRPPRIDNDVDSAIGRGQVAGWLLVPAPGNRPCRITEVTSMVGQKLGPYAEAIPSAGDVLPAADSYYEHVGGRFRFRGSTAWEVESSIVRTARAFRVSGTPLHPVEAGS
jgi:hypothetical protein